MGKDNFYATTPIYYVNDKPHIGHAYTTILADAAGLVLPKVWGVGAQYLASEITAVGDWFNAGNKFLWKRIEN